MTLAEGCMSTAWTYGVLGVHPFQLALFDPRAQADVWSGNDATLISSSYQPVGKVEPVEDGFLLSGRWGFSRFRRSTRRPRRRRVTPAPWPKPAP